MKSERVVNWWCGFEWCILNTEKQWSSNKFKKNEIPLQQTSFRMKPWYFERDCPFCTRSASSFLRKPLYFLAHAMWVKWWYHANFQPFSEFICSAFQFQGLITEKISKCMRNNKWSQKGLKIDDMALNGAFWTQKKYGVQISSKNEIPFVTDEFPYEILILWKGLTVLYSKCIQFLP